MAIKQSKMVNKIVLKATAKAMQIFSIKAAYITTKAQKIKVRMAAQFPRTGRR